VRKVLVGGDAPGIATTEETMGSMPVSRNPREGRVVEAVFDG
jgi:hypothetical protein